MRALMLSLMVIGALSAIRANGADLRAAIYVMQRDGTQVRKVAQVPGYNEHGFPSWSRDGKRLAFDAIQAGSGAKKLFVVNVDGSGLREIGATETPDWSAHDKQIACRFDGAAGQDPGIYVQNVDGQGRTRLDEGHAPRWSRDGDKLAFSYENTLKVLDLVTLEKRDLLTEPVQWVFLGFDWSPDGKRLAVVVRHNNQRHLWIVSADGSSPAKPRLKQNLDGRVAWSPDGKRLAISSNRKIYLLDPDGRGTQMLPDQRGDSVEPAWSPDGKFFAVSGNHPLAATKP
jgi:Tol biopolymer transport system component